MLSKGLVNKFLVLFLLSISVLGYAEVKSSPTPTAPVVATPTTNSSNQNIIPSAPAVDAKGYILMDANTGAILAGKDVDTRMPPASLTKLMTLYQIASALQANRIHLNDLIPISEKAWRTGGSKMFVKVGDRVPLSDLIQGIAVVSGNDACVAVAEQLGGTESSFAELMNHSAKLLGMANTHYTDATGLPDPQHYTTPRDLAILTRAIANDFPQYYHWYSQKEFFYNGIKQPNRDILLWRDPSIEGMKTGHTDEAGYCLVSTASRNGMRLIAVIMGSSSPRSRADASLALLNYGFRFYESKKILTANSPIKQPRVWFGQKAFVPVGVLHNAYVTLPAGQIDKMKETITLNENLTAPIEKGTPVGTLSISLNDKEYTQAPLVALESIPKAGFFARLKDRVGYTFHRVLHTKPKD